jgi:hypothetical protein
MERAQAAAADILEAVERGREAIDRGRDAAAEIVEAARAAMPIEAMRPQRRRRGRTAMTLTAVAVTAAAATAAYVWWKRHDSMEAGVEDFMPSSPMPRDPMAPMAPDANEPGGSFNAAMPPTQTSVMPSDAPDRLPEETRTAPPPPSTHPSPMHTSRPPMPGARFAVPGNRMMLPHGGPSLP